MQRIIMASFVLAALITLSMHSSASAALISRNNPYRSFNISGVNYASTQWERQHNRGSASKSWTVGRSGGRWFRHR